MFLHPFSGICCCSGEQWNATVADLQRPPRMTTELHWLACYVMLSRATELDGLLIARLCTRDELGSGPPQFLLDEIKRLQGVEEASLKTLESYIRRVWPDAPADLLSILSTLSDEYTLQDTSAVHIPDPTSTAASPTLSKIASGRGSDEQAAVSSSMKDSSPRHNGSQNKPTQPPLSELIHPQEPPKATLSKPPRKRLRTKTKEATPTDTPAAGDTLTGSIQNSVPPLMHAGALAADVDVLEPPACTQDAHAAEADVLETPSCTKDAHVCGLDAGMGCASCYQTCHKTCADALCTMTPCETCHSFDIITHANSATCIACQQSEEVGCHSCSRSTCWSTAPACHARCRRGAHVCGDSVREGGCTSCGRLCHANNADRRCELPLQRGDLPLHGVLDAQQQLDTLAGTQGSVPHLSQLDWRRDGVTLAGKKRILVGGQPYTVGIGAPGSPQTGEYQCGL